MARANCAALPSFLTWNPVEQRPIRNRRRNEGEREWQNLVRGETTEGRETEEAAKRGRERDTRVPGIPRTTTSGSEGEEEGRGGAWNLR